MHVPLIIVETGHGQLQRYVGRDVDSDSIQRRAGTSHLFFFSLVGSYEHPFAAPLDKFIQHQCHVSKHETADVEAEEFGGVASRQFEANMRGRRVFEAWVFNLTGYLVYGDH